MEREAAMTLGGVDFSKVSGLIALIRNGDGPSLGRLRELIGQPQGDIAVATVCRRINCRDGKTASARRIHVKQPNGVSG